MIWILQNKMLYMCINLEHLKRSYKVSIGNPRRSRRSDQIWLNWENGDSFKNGGGKDWADPIDMFPDIHLEWSFDLIRLLPSPVGLKTWERILVIVNFIASGDYGDDVANGWLSDGFYGAWVFKICFRLIKHVGLFILLFRMILCCWDVFTDLDKSQSLETNDFCPN